MATGHSGPAALCMAVQVGGVAQSNRAVLEASQSSHLNTGNYFFDKVIKNNLTRSYPASAPDARALGRLQLGPGLGDMRPSHQRSTEPSATGSPHRATAQVRT